MDEDDVTFLRAVTPIDGTFMNIGPNVDLVLVPLFHHLSGQGRVIGVEPIKVNLSRLDDAVVRNTPGPDVRLFNVALGATEG